MTDGELVRQVWSGRTEAYAELVRRWAARVVAVCHAKVGRSHWADDLAQETLLRGFRAVHALQDPDKFGPWLSGIALRTCLDWLKAKERTQVPFSALDHSPDEFYAAKSDDVDTEDVRELLAEVEALPEAYRTVVMLYYYEDVTYRDLAQTLGVSAATVNARLTKARQMLREKLRSRFSAEPARAPR